MANTLRDRIYEIAGDITRPFGGYRQSRNGRDHCIDSPLSYSQSDTAWIRLET